MTTIGKLLVFLTLVLGVGAAVFATAVYSQRPPWFSDPPDGSVAKGHVVVTFKGMARETDAVGKAAAAASAGWGRQRKELEAAEEDRAVRIRAYADLLTKAEKAATGFYVLDEDPTSPERLDVVEKDPTGRLSVKTQGKAAKGPDGKNLGGIEPLNALIAGATSRITEKDTGLTAKIARHREDQKKLGAEIDIVSVKLTRQRVIREDLQNEAAYLADAGVNVVEQKGTADRRKAQLVDRLKAFQTPE